MKQAVTILIALVMLITASVGCSKQKEATLATDATLYGIVQSVRTQLGESYVRMPIEFDEAALTKVLGLAPEDIVEFAGHYSMAMTAADCIVAIKAHSAQAGSVAEGLQRYREGVEHMFRNYLPEPYETAKTGRVVRCGDYLFLLMLRGEPDDTQQTVMRAQKIIYGYFEI